MPTCLCRYIGSTPACLCRSRLTGNGAAGAASGTHQASSEADCARMEGDASTEAPNKGTTDIANIGCADCGTSSDAQKTSGDAEGNSEVQTIEAWKGCQGIDPGDRLPEGFGSLDDDQAWGRRGVCLNDSR